MYLKNKHEIFVTRYALENKSYKIKHHTNSKLCLVDGKSIQHDKSNNPE